MSCNELLLVGAVFPGIFGCLRCMNDYNGSKWNSGAVGFGQDSKEDIVSL